MFGDKFNNWLLLVNQPKITTNNNINRPPTPPQWPPVNPMVKNVPRGGGEGGGGWNQPPPPRWRERNIVAVRGHAYDLLRHPKIFITKFDPDKRDSAEEHLLRYTTTLEALQVKHEDVACRLFSYFVEGKPSSWFFNFAVGSITSWD